jgi:hypothetical protein
MWRHANPNPKKRERGTLAKRVGLVSSTGDLGYGEPNSPPTRRGCAQNPVLDALLI